MGSFRNFGVTENRLCVELDNSITDLGCINHRASLTKSESLSKGEYIVRKTYFVHKEYTDFKRRVIEVLDHEGQPLNYFLVQYLFEHGDHPIKSKSHGNAMRKKSHINAQRKVHLIEYIRKYLMVKLGRMFVRKFTTNQVAFLVLKTQVSFPGMKNKCTI